MKFETKLKRFINKLEVGYGLAGTYFPDTEIEILQNISLWVHAQSIYVDQSGSYDKWLTSTRDAIKSSKKGYLYDDCDGYAMLAFFIARQLGIGNIRNAITYTKIGRTWKNDAHMLLIYTGGNRRGERALLFPSTQYIGWEVLTRKRAFEERGVWVSEAFDETRHFVYNKPKIKRKA